MDNTREKFEIGGKYNWKNQEERLFYMGKAGLWNQFALVEEPYNVWCEVLDSDLHMIEPTLSQAQEPVGKVVNARGEFPDISIYGHLYVDLPDETPLYISSPDQTALIEQLEKEVEHWKANHAHEVERARLIKNRTDLPLERASAYDRCSLDRVEQLEKELAEAKTQIRYWKDFSSKLQRIDARHLQDLAKLRAELTECKENPELSAKQRSAINDVIRLQNGCSQLTCWNNLTPNDCLCACKTKELMQAIANKE